MDAALKQAAGGREVACGLFEQTASPNKCGQGSTAAVTEVVGGREEIRRRREEKEVVCSFCKAPNLPHPSLSAPLCLAK